MTACLVNIDVARLWSQLGSACKINPNWHLLVTKSIRHVNHKTTEL